MRCHAFGVLRSSFGECTRANVVFDDDERLRRRISHHSHSCIRPSTPQVIRPNGEEFSFEIDAFKKHCLLNGLDKIGLTLDKEDHIIAFETMRSEKFPWLDGASMKVPQKIAMYPSAGIWGKVQKEEVSA